MQEESINECGSIVGLGGSESGEDEGCSGSETREHF